MSELSAPARHAQTSFRVLVVDDDPDMAAFLAHMLRKEGLQVDTVLDGDAALVQVLASPPRPPHS